MTRLALTLVLVTLVRCAPHAQSAQPFAGTWALDAERSESAHQAVPIGTIVLVISQDERDIIIDTRRDQETQRVRYRRDGSDQISRIGGDTITSRMSWDGPRLITEAIYTVSGFPVTIREARSLSPDGREMTVESLARVEHGYLWNFSTQNPPHYARGKDIYVRVEGR